MREIGAFEAKTHLSELLAKVEAGEDVMYIARRLVRLASSRPMAKAGSS